MFVHQFALHRPDIISIDLLRLQQKILSKHQCLNFKMKANKKYIHNIYDEETSLGEEALDGKATRKMKLNSFCSYFRNELARQPS